MSFRNRLGRHLAACAAVAAGTAGTASADIVWSGIVDLNIPSTFNGLYLNLVTGQFENSGGTGSAVPGWDINFWSPSQLAFYGGSAAGAVGGNVYVGNADGVSNLAFGTEIGAGSNYQGSLAASAGANAFNLNSSENLVGIRFFNEAGGTIHYGWLRVELAGAVGDQPRAVVEYAFESTAGASIAAGVIPAPGAIALIGLAGLAGSRRRRNG